jgi:4-nitrophenyl phosphatase
MVEALAAKARAEGVVPPAIATGQIGLGPLPSVRNMTEESSLLPRLRCFLLDMDGTFYLGEHLLPGALRFIDQTIRSGRDFLFLTNNSSKDRRHYVEKIHRLGLPIPQDKVFTSGEATALYLQEAHPGARLFVVGTPELEREFRAHGFSLTRETPDVCVLGFDTSLTYKKLWKLCDWVRAGLPFVATHADFNCPTPSGPMPDAGAMIAFVKASTGREPDVVVGKPSRWIVECAARKLGLRTENLAMVGDRLYTDIALGSTAGIATLLVLSGETRREDLRQSSYQPTLVFEDLGGVADWLRANG